MELFPALVAREPAGDAVCLCGRTQGVSNSWQDYLFRIIHRVVVLDYACLYTIYLLT